MDDMLTWVKAILLTLIVAGVFYYLGYRKGIGESFDIDEAYYLQHPIDTLNESEQYILIRDGNNQYFRYKKKKQ